MKLIKDRPVGSLIKLKNCPEYNHLVETHNRIVKDRMLKEAEKIVMERAFFEANKNKGCWQCHQVANPSLEHIIPQSLLKQFGRDRDFIEDNLDIACRRCNSLKGSDLVFHHPKTIPLLEKLIEDIKNETKNN